ncbi:MAG: AAA family ATPase [Candidatus Omnitrophica bacterium]|nr:AAA family ATPase [Candidatus Omnitrophota bacterium]
MENLINLELEQAVLGCILNDGKLIYRTKLKPEDFFSGVNQELFDIFLYFKNKNIPIDVVTITDYLKNNNNINIPLTYIFSLTSVAPTSYDFEHYEKLLIEKSFKRNVYLKLLTLKEKLEQDKEIDEVFSVLSDILRTEINREDYISFKQSVSELWDKIVNCNKIDTIPLGIDNIDSDISGFSRGSLNIIACRPSIGKTSFAIQLALNFISQKYHVMFISLEMSLESIVRRFLSQYTGIPLSKINHKDLDIDEIDKLTNGLQMLSSGYLEIIDISSLSIEDVERLASMYQSKNGLDVLIIDYLSLMNLPKAEKKVDAIGEITRRLKLLSKKLNIVTILLAQLNRNTEERTEKRPILADLRDSGNLEQDADMVFLLWRKPNEKGLPTDNGEIILCKNRDGKTNVYNVHFDKNVLRFRDVG